MAAAPTISTARPERPSMDHAALRDGGMALIRQWAARSWTDHNVHDPGITVLEACCYAMTELGLRLQLDMADLVRSGEAHGASDLVPADRVLPAGPVTRQDLRSVLLDHPLVSDVQVFLPADNEVALYGGPDAAPAPTFTPGPARVRPAGLYEVLVELSERALNGNSYAFQVVANGQNFDIELALPFWDDPEAAPFRQGATLAAIAMVLDAGQPWRALPEAQSWFGSADLNYTGPAGAGTVRSWIVMRVVNPIAQPGAVVPAILAAARTSVESTAAGRPLPEFAARVRRAAAAVDQLRTHVAEWRNLGEQAVRIGVARVQEIGVRARIEVTGGIDLEQLLADILARVHALVSPHVRFESLAARRLDEPDADRVYDGPLLRNGFLAPDSVGAAPPAVLYVSDVLRIVMQRRGGPGGDVVTQENPVGRDIVAVTDLALANYINNRPVTTNAQECLHLVEVERYRPRLSLARSNLVITRSDQEVAYDRTRVQALFDALLVQADAAAQGVDPSPVWPVVRGEVLPVGEYTPLQEELPPVYGVGHAVLPDSASTQRRAAALQLQAYLLLFEQFLSDATAQLANINRFFSADPAEDTSRFTRPVLELPGLPKLLKRFPANGNWPAFAADPANPLALALREAAESRAELLERRNRMLDHLLARQGEETVALGQELHRWAQAELVSGSVAAAPPAERMLARREAANARLLRAKAALLRDAPTLNALRLLAQGHPFSADPVLLRIVADGAAFRWSLWPQGQETLRSPATHPTAAGAAAAADNALAFAARDAFYAVVDIGGGVRRLRVLDASTPGAQVLAESAQTFNDVPSAMAARAAFAATFAQLRVATSPAPMERRIAWLTGLREVRRRRLLVASGVDFEIVDDPPGGGSFGKRWQLWDPRVQVGQVILKSPVRFVAATDAAAVALAQQSIRQVLRWGMDEWNYELVPAAGTSFTFQLHDPDGVLLALRDPALATRADAQRALQDTVARLYAQHGAEGFLLIEHLLLRPRTPADPLLLLPDGKGARLRDPYSQRLSLVFPSGCARNFALPRATAPRTALAPDRFRDPEFRRHAQRTIEQACPAHLAPSVYWVDQQLAGTPASLSSFDTLEQRYFDWLDTVLVPGAAAATVDAARAALVQALNAIADDTP